MATTRILFASDFHGSDSAWRKFLSAAGMYAAQVLVVGGDVTGKAVIPLVRQPGGGFRGRLFGKEYLATTAKERADLLRLVANSGFYGVELEPEEADALARDEMARDALFARLMQDKVAAWLELAESHLRPRGVRLFFMPGNDDTPVVDEAIAISGFALNPDGKRLWLDDDHELIGLAAANMTPWECPRDRSEDELAREIAALVAQLEKPERSVWVFHVPPHGSGLDDAPELDADLRIRHAGGQVLMKAVGSTAVRAAVDRTQPLLTLHGHIHECPGFKRLGRTLAVNAGSEYAEGVLRAALINLERDRVKGYMLVTG